MTNHDIESPTIKTAHLTLATGFLIPMATLISRHFPTASSGRLLACLALSSALLTACASHPVAQQTYHAPPAQPSRVVVPGAPATLAQARATLPSAADERTAYLLVWADQYLAQSRVVDAKALLDLLQPQSLTGNDRLRWVLLMAQVELAQQHPKSALALLDNTDLNIPSLSAEAPLALRSRMDLLRADALLLQGNLLASLQQRVSVDPLLDTQQQQYNEKMIWTVLMHLPDSQLQNAATTSQGDLLGWLQLAAIFRDASTGISHQAAQIDNWRQRWPSHPAALRPPMAIQALQSATQSQPHKVAILLPQSGPLAAAAKAIRDGLLTAYYHAPAANRPELLFIDTGSGDVRAHYQQAVNAGAQLVLGPLDKSQVTTLAALGSFPVPVLTYNYSDATTQLPARFYEYGLAPEDEVSQIAQEAWREGKRRAGLLYTNNAWGTRLADAFAADWQALGGSVVASRAYDKDGDRAVPDLLQTDISNGRAKAISRFTSLKLQFNEHPRQDLDFLFLVANPNQGRQIKPLLSFHFAGNLPVFTVSYIYQGEPSPAKDKDMDGIRFLDIPWILDDSALRQQVGALWQDHHGNLQSLFAMGLDSYRLIDYLSLLQAAPGMHLPGQTGTLSLGSDQRIHRELNWAVFNQGLAEPLPVVISSLPPSP